MTVRANATVDLYQYTDLNGNPLPTDDPFYPYQNWWSRRAAEVACYVERLSASLRDFVFGDREGEFWRLFLDRGVLAGAGLSDSALVRRWLIWKRPQVVSQWQMSWLVEFAPAVYDDPLAHIECYAKVLSPVPINRD
jgi:hypothetical protein